MYDRKCVVMQAINQIICHCRYRCNFRAGVNYFLNDFTIHIVSVISARVPRIAVIAWLLGYRLSHLHELVSLTKSDEFGTSLTFRSIQLETLSLPVVLTKLLRSFPHYLMAETDIVVNNTQPRSMSICSLIQDYIVSNDREQNWKGIRKEVVVA